MLQNTKLIAFTSATLPHSDSITNAVQVGNYKFCFKCNNEGQPPVSRKWITPQEVEFPTHLDRVVNQQQKREELSPFNPNNPYSINNRYRRRLCTLRMLPPAYTLLCLPGGPFNELPDLNHQRQRLTAWQQKLCISDLEITAGLRRGLFKAIMGTPDTGRLPYAKSEPLRKFILSKGGDLDQVPI